MAYGEHFGCDWCGLLLEHAPTCPVQLWKQATPAPTSNLRPKPLAEGTVRGMDAVRIAREMMADRGRTWDAIPEGDKVAIVQSVMGIACGAERAGWKLTRPQYSILLPDAHFLMANWQQVIDIESHVPDVGTLPEYHRRMLRQTVNCVLAAMSRVGWGLLAPKGRKPTFEGGYTREMH